MVVRIARAPRSRDDDRMTTTPTIICALASALLASACVTEGVIDEDIPPPVVELDDDLVEAGVLVPDSDDGAPAIAARPGPGEQQYLMVPPVAFQAQYPYDTTSYLMLADVAMPSYLGGNGIRPVMAPTPAFPVMMKLLAPVRLPDRARINSFECYVVDDDKAASATSNSMVALKRRTPSTGGGATIGHRYYTTAGSLGTHVVAPTVSTTYATIDNGLHQYVVEAHLQLDARPSWFGILFRGCRVGFIES